MVVYRNDELTVEEALALHPVNVVISPGPGAPSEAGTSKAMIEAFAGRVPVLGVCLGHQSIIEHYGGHIVRCQRIMHGKVSPVYHDEKGVFKGLSSNAPIDSVNFSTQYRRDSTDPHTYNEQEELPYRSSFLATRYHSLVGDPETLPKQLMVTAYTEELPLTKEDALYTQQQQQAEHPLPQPMTIMGVRHKEYTVEGVQFHPESVTTEYGMEMLKNFLKLRGGTWKEAKTV